MSEMPPPGVPPSMPPPPGGGAYVPPPPGGPASSDRTIMLVLSYLGILALIPLLSKKDDREVQWHAKNGLVLTGAEILAWIAVSILGMATAWIDLGCTGCMLNMVVWILFLVVRIVAIVKGVGGQRFIIPGLSQYVDRF